MEPGGPLSTYPRRSGALNPCRFRISSIRLLTYPDNCRFRLPSGSSRALGASPASSLSSYLWTQGVLAQLLPASVLRAALPTEEAPAADARPCSGCAPSCSSVPITTIPIPFLAGQFRRLDRFAPGPASRQLSTAGRKQEGYRAFIVARTWSGWPCLLPATTQPVCEAGTVHAATAGPSASEVRDDRSSSGEVSLLGELPPHPIMQDLFPLTFARAFAFGDARFLSHLRGEITVHTPGSAPFW